MVKIVLRERESVQEGVRRFRKLVERTGLKRELRRRERYEKPSDVKRKARNRAIRQGTAPYLASLDDDDLWLPKKLEYQMSFLKSHQDCVLAG